MNVKRTENQSQNRKKLFVAMQKGATTYNKQRLHTNVYAQNTQLIPSPPM